MTAKIIRMPLPDTCRFSTTETAVFWRLKEGAQSGTIASELGLAEPMVKEYIKSILRKARTQESGLSAIDNVDL
ncbi:LuxR C-terminal-related transcriptional regulator [Microvirga arabica]|uniref:LuxR C-terminal-related transcriptional regulator n=2 Tax=Microvirga arabica TaxID=1128671 RepID=UPI003618ACEC